MATFHPKEVFQQAQDAERAGQAKEASSHYASLSVYLRRRGKFDEALTLIRRAVALCPTAPRLYLQLALCAQGKGEPEVAQTAMATFTQLVMDAGQVEKYRSVVESTLESEPVLRQQFFDAVLELDRTGSKAFLGQARSLEEQGDKERALKVLLDALQTGSGTEDVLNELEDFLRRQGDGEALIHVGRFRDGKVSMENLSLLLRKASREPAEQASESSHAEKPLKALIEELEKEMGEAVENPADEVAPLLKEFRRRSQPILGADARARMDMSLAYFEMGLSREALEELAVIPESDPLFAEAQALAGEVNLNAGNHLAALDAFQKSLRSQNRTIEVEREARYKLVQVFFRLGDLRQAYSHAAELEKHSPSYRDLRLIKNQIQEAMERQARG